MSSGEPLLWVWEVPGGSRYAGLRADKALFEALEAGEGQWNAPGAAESQVPLPDTEDTEDAEDLDSPEASAPAGALPTEVSRSQVQKWIDEGRVLINDRPAKSPSVKLQAGDRIRIEVPPPRALELIPEDRPLDILFQDEHLVVVNKPPGLTVHPSATQYTGTLVHALLHHIRDLSGIGGVLRPGIVHRIDKDTSGALVITKTDLAHQRLVETFSKHAIERRYWALVYGSPTSASPDRETKIESLIGRSPSDRKKMSMTVKEGKRAVTYYRRIEEYAQPKHKPFASLIEARLETGRTHQVRVHLTGSGHSLLGDPVYGTASENQPKWQALPREVQDAMRALPGQALHARVLGFKHPITGQELRFEAEPPESFRLLLETLKRYR